MKQLKQVHGVVKVMMFEVEAECPLCRHAMPHRGQKSLSCDKVIYTFPFRIYYCHYHGYWVWRGKKGHQLVDFSKLKHQAIKVEPLPASVPSPTLLDYRIIEMKCPYCEGEWRQYDRTWTTQSGGVVCPLCHAEIPKEKAVKKGEE